MLVAVTALAGRAGFDVHAWQIPEVIRNYLYMAGHWQDREKVSELALEAAGRLGDDIALGMAQLAMGSLRFRIGARDDAFTLMSEALGRFQATGDLIAQAYAHVMLAQIGHSQAGRVIEDLRQAEKGLVLAQTAGHRTGEAYALGMIGMLHVQLGRPAIGISYCRRALAIVRELGDPADIAAGADHLGRAQRAAGDASGAIVSFREAVGLWEQVGYTFGHASSLLALGDALEDDSHQETACQAWQHGLELLGELYHPDAARARGRLRQYGRDS